MYAREHSDRGSTIRLATRGGAGASAHAQLVLASDDEQEHGAKLWSSAKAGVPGDTRDAPLAVG
jgi:hypothetical protein